MRRHLKKIGKTAHYGLQIVAVGGLTGLFAGVVVTLYNVLASLTEHFARDYYAFFRENPAFIPLLFLALFLGAIVIGGTLRFLPVIRGSGIPQTEGAARGLLRFKWYQMLTGMFAASLFTIFMGLSAGAEGPSLALGGACGWGASDGLRRNAVVRRYQITGGACAGLAVAFNAPLTGMAFAFEEAHKRFTPEVFVCGFSSVIVALLTRNLLRPLFGAQFGTGATFTSFLLSDAPPAFSFYAYVLLSGILCALLGVGFYYLVFLARKGFKKLTFFKGMGKFFIPFALAGTFGLITAHAMGGGHAFIESLGGGMEDVERIFSSPLWVTLLIAVAFKLIASVVNMGAGVPCGVFIPMLAIGAGAGALLSLLCAQMGMDGAYADALILICMASFFTAVVRAPVTGIVMVVELTWSFTFLLPVIVGVAMGYLMGNVFHTQPIYDRLLDELLEERGEAVSLSERLCVHAGSIAAGRTVRDVLWPEGVRIVKLERAGETLTPDGNTRIREGDVLTFEGRAQEGEELRSVLRALTGNGK